MAQYIDKSAIVAEIERRISVLKANESVISMLAGGMFVNEFKDLLSFLDTLEVKNDVVLNDTLSNDLEEAATKYAQDKYLPVQTAQSFKAGAQWQKKQTINKACEWLEEHLLGFWSQKITNTDYFIEDFKQAMNK